MDARQTMVFGDNADDYRAFRPHYPDALFAWLAGVVKENRFAWDCGSGSGQAAVGLSRHFARVLATDEDRRQLALAPKAPNIDYRSARAEDDLGLRQEVDLIACACSIHWFDLPKFYENARRALRPQGIIAAWTYDWPWTQVAAIDLILRRLKEDILGPFWGENSSLYFNRYETLPFPFEEIESPLFQTPIARSKGELVSQRPLGADRSGARGGMARASADSAASRSSLHALRRQHDVSLDHAAFGPRSSMAVARLRIRNSAIAVRV